VKERFWTEGEPAERELLCLPVTAERLRRYDHHRVRVDGCWGILLTYPWPPVEELRAAVVLRVVLHPAPDRAMTEEQVRRIVRAHPAAPAEIEALVAGLASAPEG
jgi:hypothetical protein